MSRQPPLPNVEIQLTSGLVKTILLDGVPVHGIRSISFTAEASGAIPPTVTIELWATVTLSGEMAVTFRQDRHVQRCTRAHADDQAQRDDDVETIAQEPAVARGEGAVGATVRS